MAIDVEESQFFQDRKRAGGVIVRDLPKFDLESYATNYDGWLRIERFYTVGRSSTLLSVEAFRLAIAEAKQGTNVELYKELVDVFKRIAPNDPESTVDRDWVVERSIHVKLDTDRLEHELRGYKNNLIKESIRMGNEDLGNHYLAAGDFQSAFKAYSRMREYCGNPKHIAEMTLKLLYVSIAQRNWLIANTYHMKVSALNLKEEERARYMPVLHACSGLAHMQGGKYRDAANSFLKVDSSYMTPEPCAGIVFQRQVITPNDIAVYGGLCALATMDRSELEREVLTNGSFRQFLELEPHIRRAITMFCNSKYSSCMSKLSEYTADYLLDFYLQDHFSKLFSAIRTKSIVQWFSAYSVVTIDELVTAFPPPGDFAIEDELAKMIKRGTLDARLDLVDRLLVSPNPDPRLTVVTDTLMMAKASERLLRLRLHKINMQAANLELKAPKGHNPSLAALVENSDGGNFMKGMGRGFLKRSPGPW